MFKSKDKSRTITPKILLLLGVSFIWVYLTGIVRDKLFVSMNQSMGISGPRHEIHLFSGQGLLLLKWLFTLLFSLVYMAYCLLMIRLVNPNKTLYRLCLILYGGLFGASLCIALAGKLIGYTEQSYRISRDIAGLIQSPLLIMLFFAALLLYRKLPQGKK
jgi:hypothetical protein